MPDPKEEDVPWIGGDDTEADHRAREQALGDNEEPKTQRCTATESAGRQEAIAELRSLRSSSFGYDSRRSDMETQPRTASANEEPLTDAEKEVERLLNEVREVVETHDAEGSERLLARVLDAVQEQRQRRDAEVPAERAAQIRSNRAVSEPEP